MLLYLSFVTYIFVYLINIIVPNRIRYLYYLKIRPNLRLNATEKCQCQTWRVEILTWRRKYLRLT